MFNTERVRHDEESPGRCKKCGEIINLLEVCSDEDQICPKCHSIRPGYKVLPF